MAEKILRHPPLGDVRLLTGSPFYDRQQDMLRFLLAQDTGSLLYNFRKAAGLSTRGAEPMTGWDADDCKLKGHTTGHYLSAVSLAFAATADESFRQKAEEIVNGFAECQKAFEASGRTKPGYLSAYDEEQYDKLEELTPYPDIWAPYYTLDKIMAGLLDAYELAGIAQALDVLSPLGDWVYERLSRVPEERRRQMWDTYIAGEYGAMMATLVRLYRVTGSGKHLAAARLFENPKLFDQMLAGRDGLDGMHANQHIPQAIGTLELYAATGEGRYLEIARNFESIVTGHHCYLIGGTGEEERFRGADSECAYLTEKTAESCASVNMLRLTSGLLEYDRSEGGSLMDYYERTLFNHILMSQSHCDDGGTTYFLPLAPGSRKHYETEENSCCHGTGMESRFRFMTDIFSYTDDDGEPAVRVELPVSSVLDGEEKLGVFFSDDGMLHVMPYADMKRKLLIRVPAWAEEDYPVTAGGYFDLGRLGAGEELGLRFRMELRKVTAKPDDRYYCLAWGPYLLAAVSDSKGYLHPDINEMKELPGEPGTFSCGDLTLKPLHRIDAEDYHIYFRR